MNKRLRKQLIMIRKSAKTTFRNNLLVDVLTAFLHVLLLELYLKY